MISFRLRTKWQNCRGYVPRYERTPKNGRFDIHSVFATHVETVVLLSKGVVDKDNFRKVKVDFSLEDMDLTELRGKATYAQVKEYILNELGLKVSSLYIAQVKKKCGLEVGKNSYLPKSEDARQPQVTPEKEEAIMKAFRHFGVI